MYDTFLALFLHIKLSFIFLNIGIDIYSMSVYTYIINKRYGGHGNEKI